MSCPPEDLATWLATVLRQLDGKAIGLWRVEADRLVQVGFQAPSVDPDVARGFASVTRSLSLDQQSLGIVKAALHQQPAVSIASHLPADAGSGYWLRAFGSDRSVAVPLVGIDGQTAWVFSIALGLLPDDAEVARQLTEAASIHLSI